LFKRRWIRIGGILIKTPSSTAQPYPPPPYATPQVFSDAVPSTVSVPATIESIFTIRN
jgi:hypothetical protein